MPHDLLPKPTYCTEVNEKELVGRPFTRWLDCIEVLGWHQLGLKAKCSLCWWIEKCGCLICSCCPCNAQGKAGREKKSNLIFDLGTVCCETLFTPAGY